MRPAILHFYFLDNAAAAITHVTHNTIVSVEGHPSLLLSPLSSESLVLPSLFPETLLLASLLVEDYQ